MNILGVACVYESHGVLHQAISHEHLDCRIEVIPLPWLGSPATNPLVEGFEYARGVTCDNPDQHQNIEDIPTRQTLQKVLKPRPFPARGYQVLSE